MRLLFCGDIVGRSGREAVLKEVPSLREQLKLDCVITNGENAAHGFGITSKICQELHSAGVDIITTGNHIWDQKEIIPYLSHDKRIIRPINYAPGTPGKGHTLFKTPNGKTLLVINAMARLFMPILDDPFRLVDELLKRYPLGQAVDAILLDFHGETTSEKMTMGHFCDGRVSAVIGTHTHVPTADAQILAKGTGYQSDAGMCGDYDSSIGMEKATFIARFVQDLPTERIKPAQGIATFCGTFIETDDNTGLTSRISPVRLGPRLENALPKL